MILIKKIKYFIILKKELLNKIKQNIIIQFIYPIKYFPSYIKSYLPKGLQVGHYVIIENNVEFSSMVKELGREIYIGKRTLIENCLKIGAFSSISRDVKIGLRNHILDVFSTSQRFYMKKYNKVNEDLYDHSKAKPVIIEEDVLISANVIVIEGVKIGRGAVVGAGAVVLDDVEPYSIVAGVPAKHIRYRVSDSCREEFLKIDFSNEELLRKTYMKYWNK